MSNQNPLCKNCGRPTLRWAWYESKNEPVEYWYCLECDLEGREPVIQVHPTRGVGMAEVFAVGEWAEWSSQSGGYRKEKLAECVLVVPANIPIVRMGLSSKFPPESYSYSCVDGMAGPRDHESYVFATPSVAPGCKRKLYFPRVAGLRKVSLMQD